MCTYKYMDERWCHECCCKNCTKMHCGLGSSSLLCEPAKNSKEQNAASDWEPYQANLEIKKLECPPLSHPETNQH